MINQVLEIFWIHVMQCDAGDEFLFQYYSVDYVLHIVNIY